MRKLLAALSRTFYHPHSSTHNPSVSQRLPNPEPDEAENWSFTMSDIPPEDSAVTSFTFNDAFNIRFVEEGDAERPKEHTE